MVSARADDYARAATENACTVHGPVDAASAAAVIAALVGDVGRGVLVAIDDEAWLHELGVPEALAAAGAELLAPPDPSWRARIADAAVGITAATGAVADCGVLVLTAGAGRARTTSLVPPRHICVVPVDRIVATLPDAFATLTRDDLPSAVTFIGGPSRTGDLEMIVTMGVHGPIAVDVVLVAAP